MSSRAPKGCGDLRGEIASSAVRCDGPHPRNDKKITPLTWGIIFVIPDGGGDYDSHPCNRDWDPRSLLRRFLRRGRGLRLAMPHPRGRFHGRAHRPVGVFLAWTMSQGALRDVAASPPCLQIL